MKFPKKDLGERWLSTDIVQLHNGLRGKTKKFTKGCEF